MDDNFVLITTIKRRGEEGEIPFMPCIPLANQPHRQNGEGEEEEEVSPGERAGSTELFVGHKFCQNTFTSLQQCIESQLRGGETCMEEGGR